jgi:hypothetical protein
MLFFWVCLRKYGMKSVQLMLFIRDGAVTSSILLIIRRNTCRAIQSKSKKSDANNVFSNSISLFLSLNIHVLMPVAIFLLLQFLWEKEC